MWSFAKPPSDPPPRFGLFSVKKIDPHFFCWKMHLQWPKQILCLVPLKNLKKILFHNFCMLTVKNTSANLRFGFYLPSETPPLPKFGKRPYFFRIFFRQPSLSWTINLPRIYYLSFHIAGSLQTPIFDLPGAPILIGVLVSWVWDFVISIFQKHNILNLEDRIRPGTCRHRCQSSNWRSSISPANREDVQVFAGNFWKKKVIGGCLRIFLPIKIE